MKLGINFGLDGVEDVGGAFVFSGDSVELVERVDCEEADEESGENDIYLDEKKFFFIVFVI